MTMELSDAQLVGRCRNGDAAAWNELVERFSAVLERHPEAVRKQMFGYPAAFMGGNMATGLFADRWIVRLAGDELANAAARDGRDDVGSRGGSAEDYEDRTVDELRDRAKELGIEGVSKLKKDELIDRLRRH